MCRKTLFLVALLGLVGTAWADDINPPPWRGNPGTTFANWTYDEDAPNPVEYPRLDPPDDSLFVPHPEKGDPEDFWQRAIDEGWIWYIPIQSHYETHAMQLWAAGDVPGSGPIWAPTFMGRIGVLADFYSGSYDIYNFWSEQPLKDVWIQLTWMPMDRSAQPQFFYEMEYFTLEPILTWTPLTWTQPGWVVPYWWCGGGELCGWEGGWEGFWEGGWVDEPWTIFEDGPLVAFEETPREGEWMTSSFLIELSPNPVLEFFGLFPSEAIAIDQIVIDTICYVPEPATIALLSLGGLALIRRKKR